MKAYSPRVRGCALAILVAMGVGGCRSSAPRVDEATKAPTAVVKPVGNQPLGLDSRDLAGLAEKMTASLLASGVLDRAPEVPARIALGRIVNNTAEVFDASRLTTPLCAALIRSGKAACSLAQSNTNWVLSGQITGTRKETRVVETGELVLEQTYFLSFVLADARTNVMLWTDGSEIRKRSLSLKRAF